MKLNNRQLDQVKSHTSTKYLLLMQWGFILTGMCFTAVFLTSHWFILPMVVGMLASWYGQTQYIAATLETYDDMLIQGTLTKDEDV